MPKRKPDRKLYGVLGLEMAATEAEIKAAYRKLALRYHPDKNPADPTIFPQIGAAYEVLSRPDKRKIYDRYGDFGLTLLENTGSPKLTDFLLNTKKQAWIIFVVLVIIMTFLAFPFLVTFKLAGSIKTSWTIICIPLWIFHALAYSFVILVATITYRAQRAEDQEAQPKGPAVYQVYWWSALYPLLIGFSLGLVLKSDRVIHYSWSLILAPFFVFEAFYLLLKIIGVHHLRMAWPGQDPVLPLVKGAFLFLVYQEVRWSLVRGLFAVAALTRLDAAITHAASQYLFEAFYFLGLLVVVTAPLFDLAYWRAYKFAARESQNSERLPSRMLTTFSFGIYILSMLVLSTFLGLLYHKIAQDFGLRWIWVFFPLISVAGLFIGSIFMCLPCVFCCCLGRDDGMQDEEEPEPVLSSASSGVIGFSAK